VKKIFLSIFSLFFITSVISCAHYKKMESRFCSQQCESLECVRKNIDNVNEQIIGLLEKRIQLVYQAGDIKIKNKIHFAIDKKRAQLVVDQAEALAQSRGLPVGYIRDIFQVIVDKSAYYEQIKMDSKN
jgi:chorismate mutase